MDITLQTTTLTWIIFILTVLVWAFSYKLAGAESERSKLGWRIIPLSLFGWAWLGFGVTYILRFLALAYDPQLYRATQFPLWSMPGNRLTEVWLYICFFWMVFCLGFIITNKILITKQLIFFEKMNLLDSMDALPILNFFSVVSTILIILIYGFDRIIPRIILTPLGHLSQPCFISLTIAWYWHFSGRETGGRRYLYMIPIIALYILSPYREHIMKLAACILLPLIVTKEEMKLSRVITFGVALVLILTILNQVYRSYLWEGETLKESARVISVQEWVDQPQKAPWVEASKRFHGFDSTALSVYFVPEMTPFDQRNVIIELIKTITPRFIYGEKLDIQRGRLFSAEVWSYDEQERLVERGWAMIAPSMIGDLWISGGFISILMGALIFGVIVGFLENCKKILTIGPSLAFVAVYFLLIAGAIERDFTNGVGVIIQISVVLLLVLALMPIKKIAM